MKSCTNCTACCVVYSITDPALTKPVRTPCTNLSDGLCTIYDDRPKTCSDFWCSWREGGWPHLPDDASPLDLGIVFSLQMAEVPHMTAIELKPDAFKSARAAEILADILSANHVPVLLSRYRDAPPIEPGDRLWLVPAKVSRNAEGHPGVSSPMVPGLGDREHKAGLLGIRFNDEPPTRAAVAHWVADGLRENFREGGEGTAVVVVLVGD